MIYLVLVTYFAIAGYLFWMATLVEPTNGFKDASLTFLLTLAWPIWLSVAFWLWVTDRDCYDR